MSDQTPSTRHRSDIDRYLTECQAAAWPKPIEWKSPHLELSLEFEPRHLEKEGGIYWVRIVPLSSCAKTIICRHFIRREAFDGFLNDLTRALTYLTQQKSDEQAALERTDDEYEKLMETQHADPAGE